MKKNVNNNEKFNIEDMDVNDLSITEKIQTNYYYKIDMPKPLRENFTKYYVYKQGKILFEGNNKEYIEFKLNKGLKDTVSDTVFDSDEYKLNYDKYLQLKKDKEAEFLIDLFEEFGVSDNPKNTMLFEKITSIHSDKQEIYDAFELYVDLIK